MKKILLAGYMASGKTTIARLLATTSGIPHIDLDTAIENETGKTIPELFKAHGEVYFRKLEHAALKRIMAGSSSFVLSLGGGTPCYANNHLFLQQDDVVSVYLKAGISEITARLQKQEGGRPLIDNLAGEELHEYVAKHLFDRSYFYHQAKHVVNVDGKAPGTIVDEIMSLY